MSRRRRYLLAVTVLAAIALTVAWTGAPGWWIWGKVRGEAFYRGRPTGYWAKELKEFIPSAAEGYGPEGRPLRTYHQRRRDITELWYGLLGRPTAIDPVAEADVPFS